MPETECAREGIPLLHGFLQPHPGGEVLRVWCRWCCIWHIHNTAGEAAGALTEHEARCYAPDSPYRVYRVRVSAVSFVQVEVGVVVASMAQRWAISQGEVTLAVRRLRDQVVPVPNPIP
ncbi:hypothetical protein [Streptomyces olivaceiscleroticus]|uniref:Uncharacterized protein n=1 Tax=Streptomyces olivaceiscleroticus TaxID=68245 RepID=A0ABP3LHS1_9ACTN